MAGMTTHVAYRQKPKYRETIFQRDGFACQLCGKTRQDGVQLDLDHVVPYHISHDSSPSNLRVLCHPCNLIGRRYTGRRSLSPAEYNRWLITEIASKQSLTV